MVNQPSPPPGTGKALLVHQLRSMLYFWLHMLGFVSTILVMTWGLFALIFLALGGFSLDGMMAQLYNLSGRYVAAGHERIASFKLIFAIAHLAVAGVLIVLRRHRMFPADFDKGAIDHG